jgi:hypothetical protein
MSLELLELSGKDQDEAHDEKRSSCGGKGFK